MWIQYMRKMRTHLRPYRHTEVEECGRRRRRLLKMRRKKLRHDVVVNEWEIRVAERYITINIPMARSRNELEVGFIDTLLTEYYSSFSFLFFFRK